MSNPEKTDYELIEARLKRIEEKLDRLLALKDPDPTSLSMPEELKKTYEELLK